MEDIKVRELPEKAYALLTDYMIVEDNDGTKITKIQSLRDIVFGNIYYNTVSDLKNGTFKEGDICYTLGYREINDGGAATYIIEYDPYSSDGDQMIIKLNTSDTLRAKIIIESGGINVQQIGAYGDGIHDDSKVIENAVNNNKIVNFATGKSYRIENPIVVSSNQKLNFNWSTLIALNCTGIMIGRNRAVNNVNISEVIINCSTNSNGISIENGSSNIDIRNFDIKNVGGSYSGIIIDDCSNVAISAGSISGLEGKGYGVASESRSAITSGVSNYKIKNVTFDNISITDTSRGVNLHNTNNAINISFTNCEIKRVTDDVPLTGFYLYGNINNLEIKNQVIENVNNGIVITSYNKGTIIVDQLNTINVVNVFEDSSLNTELFFNGLFTAKRTTTDVNNYIHKMYGKFTILAGFRIDADSSYNMLNQSEAVGELQDYNSSFSQLTTKIGTYPTGKTDTLKVDTFNNAYYIWDQYNDICNIEGGMQGQILLITSNENRKIITGGNIILDVESALIRGSILTLQKKADGIWHQISIYGSSTVSGEEEEESYTVMTYEQLEEMLKELGIE